MRKPSACLAFVIVVGLAIAAVAAGTEAKGGAKPSRDATLRATLSALVSRANSHGGVLVVQTPQRLWRGAAGLAQVQPRKKMSASGRFRVASVTKPFTAALVLDLVATGTLTLDDTVEQLLPGRIPGGGESITIRHLLGHRSGLADQLYGGGQFGVNGPPGPFWYANANYALLGEIVEAATASTFADHLSRTILVPLELSHTELRPSSPDVSAVVHGYSPDGKLDFTTVQQWGSENAPAAGLIATATELSRFERALFRGAIIPRELLAVMQTPGSVVGFDTRGYNAYGLGLMRFPASCGAAWGHRGDMPGYTSWMLSTADGRRTAVVLLNVGQLPRSTMVAVTKLVTRALCV